MNKVDALRAVFKKKSLDGFLVANGSNLRYFTGFDGAACLLVPKKGENIIYVFGVNYEQAKAEGKGFDVQLVKRGQDLSAKIGAQVKASKIKKLGVDGVGYDMYRMMTKGLRGIARVKPATGIVWELRKVKDETEIQLMRKAGDLTMLGMKTAYEVIRPGIKEYEAAAEIEYAMRKKGSCGSAFDSIVASGVRSAFPHGGCGDRKMRNGDLVVIDIGATFGGYRSDMTRTVVAGTPKQKQEKIYDIVRLAQQKAFEAIKPKARGKDVDAVARKIIADAGYGEYFNHGLGHGVGLDVHEPPGLSPESKDRLQVGNVVTDEPGVYLVDYGGFRVEDTVLVQKGGAERLTKGFYTLQCE